LEVLKNYVQPNIVYTFVSGSQGNKGTRVHQW
jgi:hypothetical protein